MSNNDFLASIQQEGQSAFEEESKEETSTAESEKSLKDTETESLPETKPEKDESASQAEDEDKDVSESKEKSEEAEVFHAFHEHPRWKAREEELKELREQNEKLLEFQQRAEPLLSKYEERETVKQKPQWFLNLFGDDENAWNQYQESSKQEKENLKKEILNELKPYTEIAEKSKKQKELEDWASKEWQSLAKDTEVQKDLKLKGLKLEQIQGDISKVMSKYLPTDEKTGNVSIRKSYELWKDIYKPVSSKTNSAILDEKKKIAGKTISKTKESEGEKRDYRTSADFRGKSFADLIAD